MIDAFFGELNAHVSALLFFDILWVFPTDTEIPFAVAWLVAGSLYFTMRLGFINVRGLRRSFAILSGKFKKDDDRDSEMGEVSHFQALTAALSATVGLGNIAGVAVAISLGGSGATFWMIVAGFLGMSSKFAECTLAQAYRTRRADGHVLGGPMEYLKTGLGEMGLKKLGQGLAMLFAFLTIGGSFGGGGSFQVNQSLSAVQSQVPFFAAHPWAYGLIMSFLVGIVIIGGLKRIAETAEKIVPLMCAIYLGACFYVLGRHADLIPDAFLSIITGAFSLEAGVGGFVGTMVVGFQRAAFSNEAGVGSAAIAHSAAKTAHPAEEGFVALLEPFIDTVVVCTITALVIIITGVYQDPELESLRLAREGAALTSIALSRTVSWFPMVLAVAVFLFAYSTIISWSYYGERCWVFVFGERTSLLFKVLLLLVVFSGAITSAENVINFGDLMILAMAVPNVLGLYLLRGKLAQIISDYWSKYPRT